MFHFKRSFGSGKNAWKRWCQHERIYNWFIVKPDLGSGPPALGRRAVRDGADRLSLPTDG
jgi:hypothetical protein